MDIRKVTEALFLFLFLMMSSNAVEEGLSLDFYDRSCPKVQDIVKAGLKSLSLADPTTPAAVLRLMFHDCQVQACDASILLDPENGTLKSEMASTKNFAIRKRESISIIKAMVELACPGQVSCADILILAAREAIAMRGGPRIEVPLGRRDSLSPHSFSLADASLPSANTGVDGMLEIFASKEMTIEESVAIIGAHTLGVTHCRSLRNTSSHKAGVRQADHSESELKIISKKLSCPDQLVGSTLDAASFVLNDPTPLLFDNSYFINAISGHGILRIDAEMPLDPRTAPFVQSFAGDQNHFFRTFSSAFVRLSSSSVLSGSQGVIRRICSHLN